MVPTTVPCSGAGGGSDFFLVECSAAKSLVEDFVMVGSFFEDLFLFYLVLSLVVRLDFSDLVGRVVRLVD
jgi:hypothetical protein